MGFFGNLFKKDEPATEQASDHAQQASEAGKKPLFTKEEIAGMKKDLDNADMLDGKKDGKLDVKKAQELIDKDSAKALSLKNEAGTTPSEKKTQDDYITKNEELKKNLGELGEKHGNNINLKDIAENLQKGGAIMRDIPGAEGRNASTEETLKEAGQNKPQQRQEGHTQQQEQGQPAGR